jgi:hypothetical protein
MYLHSPLEQIGHSTFMVGGLVTIGIHGSESPWAGIT